MAKVRENALINGIRGHVGKQYVIRETNGQPIVTNIPKHTKKKPTEKQVKAEERLQKLQDEKDEKAAAKAAARDAAKAKKNGTSAQPASQSAAPTTAVPATDAQSAPAVN